MIIPMMKITVPTALSRIGLLPAPAIFERPAFIEALFIPTISVYVKCVLNTGFLDSRPVSE
jgi:hypothetical protein